MGRKPLIYEKEQRPFKSDRELVYTYQNAKDLDTWKEAAYELWDKYIRVVSIGKRELIELCKRHGFKMYDVIEEYEALFWEKFLNQLYGIKLERVTHLPNWSMYIRVLGYLRAMNRDQIKAYIKWSDNTVPIIEHWENDDITISNLDKLVSVKSTNEVHSIYEKDINQKIFWESIDCLKNDLSKSQKIMLNMKIQGKHNYEIQKKLNITSSQYSNDMMIIKFKLGKIIENVASKKGLKDYSYQKLCEELQ
jgi:hypothetical protein